MFGWLKKKALDSFTETQKREMTAWIDNLAQMNSDEVATVLAVATHIRHQIAELRKIDLLDPILTYSADPQSIMWMHGLIKGMQKDGRQSDAAGVMVWLFTLRAGGNPALRGLGRRLWRELARGIPNVQEAETNYWVATKQLLSIEGYEKIPIGLEPEPV